MKQDLVADPDTFDFKLIIWVLLEFHYKTLIQKLKITSLVI